MNMLLYVFILLGVHSFLYGFTDSRLDSLKLLLKTNLPDSQRVKILYNISNRINQFNPDEAKPYAYEAYHLAKEINHRKLEAIMLENLGYLYLLKYEYDSADYYLQKSIELLDLISDESKKAYTIISLGQMYHEMNLYYNAIEQYNSALAIYEELNDTAQIICTMRLLAVSINNLGDYTRALEYNFKAVNMARKINLRAEIFFCNNNIASVYIKQGMYEKALQYLNEGLDAYGDVSFPTVLFSYYENLGVVHCELKNQAEAIQYYEKAIELAKQMNDDKKQITILLNWSKYLFKSGQLNQCEEYLLKAHELALKRKFDDKISSTALSLAVLFNSKKDKKKALHYALMSYGYASRIKQLYSIYETSELLSQLYAELGNYKEAYNYHVINKTVSDSLLNESKIEEIMRLEMQHEFNKKQQETEFISRQKELSYKTDVQQQKAIRNFAILGTLIVLILSIAAITYIRYRQEKNIVKIRQDLFLYMQRTLSQQMNPHFIFNILNSIQYLLDQNKREESKKYIEKFALLMRTALNNSQYPTVALADEVDFLKLYADLEALRFKNPFELIIDVDKNINQHDLQIPSFLLQPLIENSIKHGLMPDCKQGKIAVRVKHTGDFLECSVEDNGIGFETSARQQDEKDLQGTKHQSMATNLLQKRLTLLSSYYNKRFMIQYSNLKNTNEVGCGTRVTLQLPVIEVS